MMLNVPIEIAYRSISNNVDPSKKLVEMNVKKKALSLSFLMKLKISLFYLGIKKKRKTIVITKNLKKKDGKGQDLDHTAQIGEEEVDQGQKTGGDESQGQGEYINCLQYYKVIVDYM